MKNLTRFLKANNIPEVWTSIEFEDGLFDKRRMVGGSENKDLPADTKIKMGWVTGISMEFQPNHSLVMLVRSTT